MHIWQYMVYLPTKLGDFVRANVSKFSHMEHIGDTSKQDDQNVKELEYLQDLYFVGPMPKLQMILSQNSDGQTKGKSMVDRDSLI